MVVPPELFSDPGVKAAFKHFTEHGKARGLGESVSSAKERQMTSQQFKRMLGVTGAPVNFFSLFSCAQLRLGPLPPTAYYLLLLTLPSCAACRPD